MFEYVKSSIVSVNENRYDDALELFQHPFQIVTYYRYNMFEPLAHTVSNAM